MKIFDNLGPFGTLKKGRRLIGLDEYPKINFTNMTTTISFELPTSPSTISVTTIRKFLVTISFLSIRFEKGETFLFFSDSNENGVELPEDFSGSGASGSGFEPTVDL